MKELNQHLDDRLNKIQLRNTINKNKIYAYLGYKKEKHILTDDISNMVSSCEEEILEIARPKVIFSPILSLSQNSGGLFVDRFLLQGKNIKAHLKDCDRAVFLVATLGAAVDKAIRTEEIKDMTRAVILDCTASVFIDEVANLAENKMRKNLFKSGDYLTKRYSPGYGDFPIEFGREILMCLDAPRKIGLSITESGIMTPRKSISAILGISKTKVTGKLATCESCLLREKCVLRKEGKTCGENI